MTEEPVDTCDLLCLDLPHAEQIRAELPAARRIESAAAAGRALGDPTRLTIAAALASGNELCVCDMAWVVGQAQNLVSHHLRQLKIADLVSSRRQGRLVMYSLTPRGRALVGAVLGDQTTALPVDAAGSSEHVKIEHV
ncbi:MULTISPECIES: metalloregulator ArsR/SmtB family transcription factor [unclassified Rhodococcus (in: high G+C Gram-positive bacteria)]|uniref:ArsR/SmtB family transcription factor n=1 Tax=unclassified Rhodococcus (in: high G+C Gram-positive bacteria) TaxID=192944 RepID=UPI00163A5E6A|nr:MULTISPECIES: metalloregulator ArsR/SmtB family transcription factor [unclassified Rhodococcus (in: high G+C Gram-positive bacteria)]MBC2644841.1 winged helix-turn-helix transcriptional regulator [Rhodococcus sp. 3A]MBC2890842.1 winged helix-turn-helix transcriptional regulator [Rhodococcus sp. 4CII]